MRVALRAMGAAMILLVLLAAAPALPDQNVPLGLLSDVLVAPETSPANGEKVVQLVLEGCDHPVKVNVSRFTAGATYALQQLGEWMAKTKGLEDSLARKGAFGEVTSGIAASTPSDDHACAPLP